MKIPWIESWNEHRRRKAEARKESREVERMAKAYDGLEKSFSQAFGLPFELAVRAAIAPHMAVMVREALPDNLAALAHGNPAMTSSDPDPGILVASLSRSTGAYWGPAPEGGAAPSTAAFHASVGHDADNSRYLLSMLPGMAQVVGYAQSGLLELTNAPMSFPDNSAVSYWVWLEWSQTSGQNTNVWSVRTSAGAANATPSMGGDLNVPLFKFWVDSDGDAHIVQLVEGAVLLPWTVNALDVDAAPAASSPSPSAS